MEREQVGRRRHLLVGDDDAVDVVAPGAVGVAPARIQMQPDAVGRVRPLAAQRRRRADDDHLRAARRAHRLACRERLAGARRRDEQEVPAAVRAVARQERGLPGARRDGHAGRAPLARLQRGHRARPFAGSVAPPELTGVTWSACQPGRKAAPHRAHFPCAARNSATRAAGLNRRAPTRQVSQSHRTVPGADHASRDAAAAATAAARRLHAASNASAVRASLRLPSPGPAQERDRDDDPGRTVSAPISHASV